MAKGKSVVGPEPRLNLVNPPEQGVQVSFDTAFRRTGDGGNGEENYLRRAFQDLAVNQALLNRQYPIYQLSKSTFEERCRGAAAWWAV